MTVKGVILELRKKEAVIINERCEYVKIKRIKGMVVGNMIEYEVLERKNIIRHIVAIAGVAAVFAFIICYCFLFQSTSPQVYAYVNLDINPSMELAIDRNNNVIGLIPLNSDAEGIVNRSSVKGMNINEAISSIIVILEAEGYIEYESDNMILLSASIIAKSGISQTEIHNNTLELKGVIDNIKDTIENHERINFEVEVIYANPGIREVSSELSMSMGRYMLFTNATSKGVNITIHDAMKAPLRKLIIYALDGNPDDLNNAIEDMNDETEESKVLSNKDNENEKGVSKQKESTPIPSHVLPSPTKSTEESNRGKESDGVLSENNDTYTNNINAHVTPSPFSKYTNILSSSSAPVSTPVSASIPALASTHAPTETSVSVPIIAHTLTPALTPSLTASLKSDSKVDSEVTRKSNTNSSSHNNTQITSCTPTPIIAPTKNYTPDPTENVVSETHAPDASDWNGKGGPKMKREREGQWKGKPNIPGIPSTSETLSPPDDTNTPSSEEKPETFRKGKPNIPQMEEKEEKQMIPNVPNIPDMPDALHKLESEILPHNTNIPVKEPERY